MGVQRHASSVRMGLDAKQAGKAVAAASVAAGLVLAQGANALSNDEIQSLTYLQIKGIGQANRCPDAPANSGSISLSGGKTYKLDELCIEPKIFAVEEDIVLKGKGAKASKAFIPSKVMTRETYTLTGIEGDLKADGGKITFDEKDGIDYAATTVQTPGGERIPFLFTVKSLKAVAATSGSTIGPGFQMGGKFKVPSYRAGTFLDPKGRGQTTGYDQAQALPGLQADGGNGGSFLFKEDNKVADTLEGEIQMEVTNVNAVTGEIGGVFVSEQPGDTDMGALKPRTLLLKGVFYGSIHD